MLKVNGIPPCSKGFELEMKKAWAIDTSLPKIRVLLETCYLSSTTSSTTH
jgi:hypothetical protein